jgi:riboflavin biosynthesis pyrimidine reductase
MRTLLPAPADPSAEVDLHAFYGADWNDPGGVRMNFVTSVDGAVTADGKSKGLQTPGDNRVFSALRDLADVILVGAGTIRVEGYGPAKVSDRRRAVRREHGYADVLPTAVVSGALRLDPSAALFTEAPAGARTIVITCAAGDAGVRAALERVADVLVCGDEIVDLQMARAALLGRGLRRILSEGGPTLFADLAGAGAVDELCLSVTPMLAGPGARRIVSGTPWPDSRGLRLHSLLEEDGALFARYLVAAG